MFIYTFIIFSIACEIVRRPVTLWFSKASFRLLKNISCLGKLFTAILSERLSKYSDDFFVMHENQYGFRQGYCTVDNLSKKSSRLLKNIEHGK
jgi:hypothetical protein